MQNHNMKDVIPGALRVLILLNIKSGSLTYSPVSGKLQELHIIEIPQFVQFG